ncbi:hypothetical protein SteCoe_14697 [Stentor coeruleus]|uniref:Uncharacterized protein n=1 Tax=Stentor coeruleus TaxID=5963 RepID=A0A1R2C5F6_9CILI|nr:hypothetical protein SteCoe_14697 [Stentor coeruleus]
METPMTCMKKLVLDNNRITSLNVTNFPNLEHISCVENNLTEFFGLTSLQNLTHFYADGNDLTELPSLTRVRFMSIAHNRLSGLANFPSLEVLNASYNCIEVIQKVGFCVKELFVAHNILTTLPFGMKRLEVLDVSHNNVRKLSFLVGCNRLKVLYAGFNDINIREEVIKCLVKCPLIEADLGFTFEDGFYYEFLRFFPLLIKFGNKKVMEEDRKKAQGSEEIVEFKSFDNEKVWEKPRVLSLEIPEIVVKTEKYKGNMKKKVGKNTNEGNDEIKSLKVLTISPNNSIEVVNKNSEKTQARWPVDSPRNTHLEPSHTESFSIFPNKTVEENFHSGNDESRKSVLNDQINDMCKSIVSQVHQSISEKFEELAKTKSKHHLHRCRHHCKHRKPKLATTLTVDIDAPPIAVKKNPLISNAKNHTPISSKSSRHTIIEKEFNFSPDLESDKYSTISKYSITPSSFLGKSITENLLKYATIPTRPILKSECNSALVTILSKKTKECQCLIAYFGQKNLRVKEVKKTFTFSLMKGKSFSDFGFFYTEESELMSILYCNHGFGNREVTLHKNLDQSFCTVLMCLTNLDELREIYKDTYQTEFKNVAIPVYMVSYSNFS